MGQHKAPNSKEVVGLIPGFVCSPCICSLQLLRLPHKHTPHTSDHLEFPIHVVCMYVSVNGCLSLCDWTEMNWNLVQGPALPSPYESWDMLQ